VEAGTQAAAADLVRTGGGSCEDGRRRLDRGREEGEKFGKGGSEGFGVETPVGFGPGAGRAGGFPGEVSPAHMRSSI
jgi:hypothetical protein